MCVSFTREKTTTTMAFKEKEQHAWRKKQNSWHNVEGNSPASTRRDDGQQRELPRTNAEGDDGLGGWGKRGGISRNGVSWEPAREGIKQASTKLQCSVSPFFV